MEKVIKKSLAQEFQETFNRLCRTRAHQGVWHDFVLMSACCISNAVDKSMFDTREKMYLEASKKYSADELRLIAQLFALTVFALEENPEQDFLGGIFVELGLLNKKLGQVFTPYHLSKAMARLTQENLVEEIKEKGHVSVNDPCCGAGVMLIAYANAARELGVNYQRDIIFVAQDIDFTVAMMAYIQNTNIN